MPSKSGSASADLPEIAITGATGFVGKQVLRDFSSAGVKVSALTRQSAEDTSDIRWIKGDLFDTTALTEMIRGAQCVIHLAGATKALHASEFHAINTQATVDLAGICADQGVEHFVFLSSLAATRPTVSPYAASKAAAETALAQAQSEMNITTIRAPAVLGPHDSATYPLFSNLAKGILPVPGGSARDARFSIIDVLDLSRLLIELAKAPPAASKTLTPYGHESIGWQDVADSATRRIGKPVRQITVPLPILGLIAKTTDFIAKLTRTPQVFSSDKLQEMKAGDWIATSQVSQPTELDDTMRRCLTPFQNK